MPSLRDPLPEDRKPSWKRRSLDENWPGAGVSTVRANAKTSWSESDSSISTAKQWPWKLASWGALIALIASVTTGIFAGYAEKRFRLATQGEVAAIVEKAEAERNLAKKKYEDGQKAWEKERNQLQETITATRKARDAAQNRANELATENAVLREKLSSREQPR